MAPISPAEARSRLMACAQGQEKADLALVEGDVVDVYTGEVLPSYSVAVKGERIAYVGQDIAHLIGPQTQVIEARGKVLVPGFIDAHLHLIYFVTPDEFLKYAIPGGTTAVVTETLELAFPLGLRGVLLFLAALRRQPIKIFALAPAMVTPSPAAEALALTPQEIGRLLRRPEVVGLGETYWAGAVNGNPRLLSVLEQVRRTRKTLEGHTAGARGGRLQAYLTQGFSSCHEPITPEEVVERARLGLWVQVREGSVRRELEAVARVKDSGIDFRRLCLCTDGLEPGELMAQGHMNALVQKALDLGLPPVAVFQMASLNAAEHFHLEGDLGGIAPGKYADILVLPELRTIQPEFVISNGQVVAREGKLLASPRPHRYPRWAGRGFPLPHPLSPQDFALRPGMAEGEVPVRVIEMVTDLVTREGKATLPVRGGEVRLPPGGEVIKAAVVQTIRAPGQVTTALLRGYGLRRGACASSAPWEAAAVVVVGASEADMAGAVNRVSAMGGGVVVVAGGEVLVELPLPIGGQLSSLPIEEVARKMAQVNGQLKGLGAASANPYLSLITLTTGAIPHLRLTEAGLASLRDGKISGVFV